MLKQFVSTLLAIFAFVLIAGGLLILVLSISLRDIAPEVKDGSVLVLDLNRPITDKPVSVDPRAYAEQIFTGAPLSTFTLRELILTIDHAAADDRISAIYLTGSVPSAGTATLRELREALDRFREAEKPIYAYNPSYNMRNYFLASAADSIFVHPLGSVNTAGYSMSRTFYKDALDDFGVKVYVARQSSYKSALEPYFRTSMSDEDREQRILLMQNNFSQFANTVAESRDLTPERISQLSENYEFLQYAQPALENGIVDEITYYDTVLDKLKDFTGVEEKDKAFTQISFNNYFKAVESDIYEKGDGKLALIYAEGSIIGGSGKTDVAGDYTARLLRQARNDDKINGVVVRVNSPGGGVMPSEVILREMRLLAEAKPVVVSMGNVAASGGYWISSYANHIVANPTTVTGSIGIYRMFPVLDDIASDYGISFDGLKTHEYSDLYTSDRSPTEEEWNIIQAGIDRGYENFLQRVAEGRNLDMDHVRELAKGRVWSGIDALELGLVDELGGLSEALTRAGELAELESWEVSTYQKKEDFRDRFTSLFGINSMFDTNPDYREPPLGIKKLAELLTFFNQLDDPNHLYARMPYDIVTE